MPTHRAELTPLQAVFLEELLKSPDNHSEAYRRACAALGRPPLKNAGNESARLLRTPVVEEAWNEMRRTRAIRVQITTDMVLEELWNLVEVDATQFMNEDGGDLTVSDFRRLTKKQRRAIKSIERRVDKDGVVRFRIEMWNRERLLELAGKHTGAWAKGEAPIIQGDVHQNNVIYVVGVPQKERDVEAWTKLHGEKLTEK